MSQQTIAIFLSFLLIFSLLLGTCGPAVQDTEAPAASQPAEIANPAAKSCKENGGKLEIRTAEDGSQSGACVFPDGSECEEWAFSSGACSPAPQLTKIRGQIDYKGNQPGNKIRLARERGRE